MVDKKSEEFIRWCMDQLSTREELDDLLEEVVKELMFHYAIRSLDGIREELEAKMRLGAMEHGEPKLDVGMIEKELGMEFLDLCGWYLMKKYARQEAKS